jgi:hypothetical protein
VEFPERVVTLDLLFLGSRDGRGIGGSSSLREVIIFPPCLEPSETWATFDASPPRFVLAHFTPPHHSKRDDGGWRR